MTTRILTLVCILCSFFSYSRAQKASEADTLRISINQADSFFLISNFDLLASAMNSDAQKAQILQAKLYPNPVFTADFNAYDPQNHKAFHIGDNGQYAFQLDQLILLGGKRKSAIELAKTNAEIAELEFQSLVRQLKYKLHISLYSIKQQTILLDKYNVQLNFLDTILAAYETQVAKGNFPLKDLIRLKGVYLNLNNDRAELLKAYFENQTAVQTILQTTRIVSPVIPPEVYIQKIKLIGFEEISNAALVNRPDYLLGLKNQTLAQQYYSYQKKLAVPDVNLFTSYDRQGGAFKNQVNAGFAIPIPLWHRNQGNIATAASQVKQQGYQAEGLKSEILSEVRNNLSFYNQAVQEFDKSSRLYNSDFEFTLRSMSENFQKRNVSLIEFVDFFESYNNVLSEISRIRIQLANSMEQLNLNAGTEIFK